MDTEEVEAGDLAEGDLVVIDGEACLIRSLDTSSGGKHGTAKVNIEAEALADGSARSLTQPEDGDVPVPAVEAQRNPLVLVGGTDHFDPPVVAVPPGGNVVWLWDDGDPHRLVAEDGAFASEREAGEGVTAEHTFGEPGTYAVGCEEHAGLCVVVVGEDE